MDQALALFLGACGALVVIGNAVTMLWKVVAPIKKQTALIAELDRRSKLDFAARQRQDEFNIAIARGLMRSLRHQADGNHTGEMRDAADKLNDFLIER